MLTLLTNEEQDACSYRALDDKVVAFRELRLDASAIASVTLGPKHVPPSIRWSGCCYAMALPQRRPNPA